MNDSRPAFTRGVRQILEMIEQCMNEGPFPDPRAGMHDEPGGLLNYGEILVLEVDLDGDLLRPQWGLLQRLQIDLDGLSSSNPIPGFFVAAFDVDRSRPVELLYL